MREGLWCGVDLVWVGWQWYVCMRKKEFDRGTKASTNGQTRVCTQQSPVAVRMAKKPMQEGMQADLHTGLELERLCYAQVGEGRRANGAFDACACWVETAACVCVGGWVDSEVSPTPPSTDWLTD